MWCGDPTVANAWCQLNNNTMSELEEHVMALVWENKVDPMHASVRADAGGAGTPKPLLFTSVPGPPGRRRYDARELALRVVVYRVGGACRCSLS